MFFLKLILIHIKNHLLFILKVLTKNPFFNFKKDIIIKKISKDKDLKDELIIIKLIPLTFYYEPLLINIKENNNLEDLNLKNKFKKKYVELTSKHLKLNSLLLNFYNIEILKNKKKKNVNSYYIQLTVQERNQFVNYYNSDLLFFKNSFIFYEDMITLDKKKYLLNYNSYKKYGFSSYSDNIFSSNETKITNISSYSFRLEDGGTTPTWTSFIFNDSMKFLFFFYVPYIFYSCLEFCILYTLIILVLSSDFIFIFKNYLFYSSSEYSFFNLILYKILFDNPIILFFQNLFLLYFDFLIKFFYINSISIYIQIFFFILFFVIFFFWVYENIINLLLLDFFSVYLKKKDVASDEISSFVDDFLNEDSSEEIRDVHMPMTFADSNIPHRQGDSSYDLPRGTDYQKFITPFFTLYLFFIASWNYLFLSLFFYIFYIFWSDFDFFTYLFKFYLFKFFDITNLNSFFYYNIDFEFFSYLPLFFYILPFFIIIFIITFSLKFSGFTYLYEDLYVKYKLKTEKGFYIYYNLFKKINLKTLFINLFSTKSVYYIDRNLISNKNTNIFFFCLNMIFLFLKPIKNVLIFLLLLILLVFIVNFIITLLINICFFFIFILKVLSFFYSLINIKLVLFLKFLIIYLSCSLFLIKMFFYTLILFYVLIFLFNFTKYFYFSILNIFSHFLKFKIKKNNLVFLCLTLIILRLFFFKFIFYYSFIILFFFINYSFLKSAYKLLSDYLFYNLNYIRFLFIKVIIYTLKYKIIINILFYSLILIVILKFLLMNNIYIVKFLFSFFSFCIYIYPYFILSVSNFIFLFIFFVTFFYFFYFVIFLLFIMSQEYIFFKWLNYYLNKTSTKKIKYLQNNFQVKKYLKKRKKNYIFKESTNYLKRKDYFFFFSSIYTYHKGFKLIRNEYHILSKKMLKYKKFKIFIFFKNSFIYFIEFFYLKLSQSIIFKFKFFLLKITKKINLTFLNIKNQSKFVLKLEHYYFTYYEQMYLFKQTQNNSLVLKELAFLKKKYGQDSDIFSKIDHKMPLNIFLKYDLVFIYIVIISEEKKNKIN